MVLMYQSDHFISPSIKYFFLWMITVFLTEWVISPGGAGVWLNGGERWRHTYGHVARSIRGQHTTMIRAN